MALSTSLVDFQDFKHQMTSSDCGILAVEQFMKDIEFPTPPLSPDHEDQGTSMSALLTTPTDSSLLMPQSGMDTMMQLMGSDSGSFFDNEGTITKITYCSDSSEVNVDPSVLEAITDTRALLQDCMWNSVAYEPRHSVSGLNAMPCQSNMVPCGTNLTFPTPTRDVMYGTAVDVTHGAAAEDATYIDDEIAEEEVDDEIAEEDVGVDDEIVEEEIDVVTVSNKPTMSRLNTRKRILSQSAPCSRQASPSAGDFLPPKKRRCHTKRAHRLNSAGSNGSNMAESDEEQKRASHNILERKRRNDLKSNFQTLRSHIPELEDNQRAPKVAILRKAADFIYDISVRNDDLERKFDQEKRREAQLLHRITVLKAYFKS